MRRQTSAHTQTCKRLVKEWAFYVSKSKCLSKVFVSIKGVYFQAEVIYTPYDTSRGPFFDNFHENFGGRTEHDRWDISVLSLA